jgi:hypothetical protein
MNWIRKPPLLALITGAALLYPLICWAPPPPPFELEISIEPDGSPNAINTQNNGLIPVAIFGSEVFDVTTIDVLTLRFGPDAAVPAHRAGGHYEDVNSDGFEDIVSHYATQETGIAAGDISACVIGETFDGTAVGGCDAISTRPPNP